MTDVEQLAQLSDHLFTASLVTYAFAMVFYAGQYAFGGRAAVVGRLAFAATLVGGLMHGASLATRGLAAERVPWGNMYEFVSLVCFAGVLVWLFLSVKFSLGRLGIFVMLPVVVLLGLAGTVLYTPVGPLVPALDSVWLAIHVSAAAVSSGIFLVGFVTAVLYLIRQRYENKGDQVESLRFPLTLAPRLPEAERLERLTFRIHAFAFPLWTFAIIAGAIWAEAAWTRYWGWDPKETWAFISWIVYAAYLHARSTGGWQGPKATSIAIVGWVTMLINLFAINFITSGLHSYA